MDSKLLSKLKILLFIIVIICTLLLCINTNNNPYPIIERIFKPISIGKGTIHYAGIITIFLIYYSINQIYKNSHSRLLNTKSKRIIALILIIYMATNNVDFFIKDYKGLSSNLNSIYCNREKMNLTSEPTTNGNVKVVCNLELENCSLKVQKFYVKVDVPSFLKGKIKDDVLVGSDIVTGNREFVLLGKEKRNIKIKCIAKNISGQSNWGMNVTDYEFSIYNNNNNDQIKFIQMKENE